MNLLHIIKLNFLPCELMSILNLYNELPNSNICFNFNVLTFYSLCVHIYAHFDTGEAVFKFIKLRIHVYLHWRDDRQGSFKRSPSRTSLLFHVWLERDGRYSCYCIPHRRGTLPHRHPQSSHIWNTASFPSSTHSSSSKVGFIGGVQIKNYLPL